MDRYDIDDILEEARRLKEQGKKPPAGAVLTPLAREILEQP